MVTGRVDELLKDRSFLNAPNVRHQTCLLWLLQYPLMDGNMNGTVKPSKQARKEREDQGHAYGHSVACEEEQLIDERYTVMTVKHSYLRMEMTN